MAETSRKIGITRYLSRRLLPLSIGIGLLSAVGAPVTFWLVEHSNLQHHVNLYAVNLAEKFREFALESPTLWKYQTYQFINIAEGFHPTIEVSGFRVLDEEGEPISGYEYKAGGITHFGALTVREELHNTLGTAPILFNNQRVGTIEVMASDAYLLRSTAILFGISTVIGAGLALLLFRFPVRVAREAEAEIESLVAAMRAGEEKYRSLVDNIPDIVWTADSNGNTAFISDNIEKVYGYTPADICASRDALWFGSIHWDDVRRVKKAFESLFTHGTAFDVEYRIRRKDGEWIWLHDRATKTYERNGVRYVDGIGTDITKRKRVEESLLESEGKFRSLAEKSLVGVYIIQDGVFQYLNPKFKEIFGYEIEELIGRMGPRDLTDPEDWPVVQENLRKRISGEIDSIHYEFKGVTKEQKTIYLEVYGCRTVFQGKPAVIGTLLDITDRRRAEHAIAEQARKLEQLALFDELTGLFNRRGFLLQAGQQLKTAARLNKVALLIFTDMDGLKGINDRFGHHEGDAALKEVAAILKESFRGSDIIGRLGGDEFAVFALSADPEGEEIIASRLSQNIAGSNAGVERQYPLSVSFGVARYDISSPCTLDELIDRADAVMYARKLAKKVNGEVTPL